MFYCYFSPITAILHNSRGKAENSVRKVGERESLIKYREEIELRASSTFSGAIVLQPSREDGLL